MMKSLIKRAFTSAVHNDLSWNFLKATVIRGAEYATWERVNSELTRSGINLEEEYIAEVLSPDFKVMHGPFKGMKYPGPKSVGSSLIPKLLGSYEKELHELIEEICSKNYSEIVDIGCAEGYYAVGLAMRIKSAKVFAFDINQDAIKLCQQMAQLNGVTERIELDHFCDADKLRAIQLTKKALIVSDCEGHEKELFNEELIPFLANHDLLIEVHDFMDINISSTIKQRFRDTHDVTIFQSLDDITKAHTYQFEELRDFELVAKKRLLAECRPSIMEWFYLTPRMN